MPAPDTRRDGPWQDRPRHAHDDSDGSSIAPAAPSWRTPEEQARRDRLIPRPPDGLQAVPPRLWLPVWDTVAARPPVRVTGYLVARRYADYADGADIRPGAELLAEMTCQSVRTVQDALAAIRGYGLLWRYVRGSVQGPRRAVDVLRLTVPDDMTRVPRTGDHRQVLHVDNGDHRQVLHVDNGDHRQMTTRPPADDDTDHRQELPTTYIRDLVQDLVVPARARASPAAPVDRDDDEDEPESRRTSRVTAALIRSALPDATDDEIATITRDRTAHGARSVPAVIRHEIAQGTLRLPCDPRGPGAHSEACRHGDSGCAQDWCACRCHRQAVTR